MKVVNCIHALAEIALKDNVHPPMQHLFEEQSLANYEANQSAAPTRSRDSHIVKEQEPQIAQPSQEAAKEEPKTAVESTQTTTESGEKPDKQEIASEVKPEEQSEDKKKVEVFMLKIQIELFRAKDQLAD